MALTLSQQCSKLIEDKKNILIVFDKHNKGDAIASATALLLFLQKLGKRVDIISQDYVTPKTLQFLKGVEQIKSEPEYLQQFVITIDTQDAGVHELSYDIKDKQLRIFVTPKKGFYKREHLTTGKTDFKYDLIITIDTPDLESLGDMYDKNTQLFFETPIINIDAHSSNEHYGHINIVDMTATTTAEVVYTFISEIDKNSITEDVATALLTGIISHTHSFKGENISPKTLALASTLISLGADRDFIVKNLYRTRSVATLRLWGEALTSLQFDHTIGLVSSILTKNDIARSGANTDDIPEIIEELISNSPQAKLTLLLFENLHTQEYTVEGLFVTDKGFDAMKLVNKYNPTGSLNYASFKVKDIPIVDLKKQITEELLKQLS